MKKKEDKLEELQSKYDSERKQVQKLKNTFLNPRDLKRDDTKELKKHISKLYVGIEGSDTLDHNAILTIWGNKPGDREFIINVQKLNMPKIKKLTLSNMAGIE